MTTILLAVVIGLLVGLIAWVVTCTVLARRVYEQLLDQGVLTQEPRGEVEETESFLHGDFFAPTGTDPR